MGVVLHRPIIVLLLARKSQPNVTRPCSYFVTINVIVPFGCNYAGMHCIYLAN